MNHLKLPVSLSIALLLVTCVYKSIEPVSDEKVEHSLYETVMAHDRAWILESADNLIHNTPRVITEGYCDRSEGGPHDFYSEGDYWWPNPEDLDGPYIRKDGMTNPDNFVLHRQAMREMSINVATLTAAYVVTREESYADYALVHLESWFLNPDTRMAPNMAYAQAIKGRVPGRGVGLIDGIHLVEPAQALIKLNQAGLIPQAEYMQYQAWFAEFLTWMTTHEYGIDERDRKNNHGTCWVLQAAAFARLTVNNEVLEYCRDRYKTVLLPNQMSNDGSFHLELSRTKPYGYSLFNMDMMASVCHTLSTTDDNLWTFELESGQSMGKAMQYIYPYIKDKSKWPLEPDVMYWDEWPARHPALLFAHQALGEDVYMDLWKTFAPLPKTQEGLRNFPLRQPVLWLEEG